MKQWKKIHLKWSWNKVHVPVSLGTGCNVEGWKHVIHASSKDPYELVSQSVYILLQLAEKKKYRATVEQFKNIFEHLEQLKVQEMDHLDESNEAGGVCFG